MQRKRHALVKAERIYCWKRNLIISVRSIRQVEWTRHDMDKSNDSENSNHPHQKQRIFASLVRPLSFFFSATTQLNAIYVFSEMLRIAHRSTYERICSEIAIFSTRFRVEIKFHANACALFVRDWTLNALTRCLEYNIVKCAICNWSAWQRFEKYLIRTTVPFAHILKWLHIASNKLVWNSHHWKSTSQ